MSNMIIFFQKLHSTLSILHHCSCGTLLYLGFIIDGRVSLRPLTRFLRGDLSCEAFILKGFPGIVVHGRLTVTEQQHNEITWPERVTNWAELVPPGAAVSWASLSYRFPLSAAYPLSIPYITPGTQNRWRNNVFKGITLQLMASLRERAPVV